jgi:uncharacterized protein (DUF427 family)
MMDLLAGALNELRYEPLERRVRADGVVDSTRAVLVWEPRRVVPSYAVPAADIAATLSPAAATNGEVPAILHPGIPFSVHTAAGEPVSVGDRIGAGFRLDDADLAGYVALDFDAFEEWHEEDEPIVGHPREPFHRVDTPRTSRRIRIELDGELIADTTGARIAFETSLPARFYVPREDIVAELRPSETRTYCPYKGEASYFSVGAREDLAWSYEQPLPDAVALAGLVAFWDERVDMWLDGERRERPGGAISEALLDEFGA